MKEKILGFLHTSATLVPMFEQLCKSKLPSVKTFNLVDDSLIKEVIARGKLTPRTTRRVAQHIAAAEDAGADLIVVTCSSIGAAVETAEALASVPVLRVDRPMVDRAVQTGQHLGVIATLPTTLEPTVDLIHRRAAVASKQVEVTPCLCQGAFDALMGGNVGKHDAMVLEALQNLAMKVDVVVLAQASMARIVETLPTEFRLKPVLASPPLAIDYVATVL